MGYSNVNAQLLTVPVYILGAASFLIVAKLSDRYKIRSPFIVLGFFLQIIGYIILATCDNVHGRYGGVFIVALGLYLPSGLNVTWLSGNMAGHYKRVTGFATNQLIGNAAGASWVTTSFLWLITASGPFTLPPWLRDISSRSTSRSVSRHWDCF